MNPWTERPLAARVALVLLVTGLAAIGALWLAWIGALSTFSFTGDPASSGDLRAGALSFAAAALLFVLAAVDLGVLGARWGWALPLPPAVTLAALAAFEARQATAAPQQEMIGVDVWRDPAEHLAVLPVTWALVALLVAGLRWRWASDA